MPPQVKEAAQRYRDKGLAITWIRPGEKRPNRKNWTRASQEPDDYKEGDNLGIQCGRLSDDLVCVDLDSAEALAKADKFLPPTEMVEGRPGKPRSHRYYRVTDIPDEFISTTAAGGIGGPKIERFNGILDFQGTGSQVVAPPSVHSSGETREWHSEGEPAEVRFDALWLAVVNLARACGWRGDGDPKAGQFDSMGPTTAGEATKHLDRVDLLYRAGQYLAKVDPAISGKGGHDQTFRAACLLVGDFDLTYDEAWPLLLEYNRRCVPLWEEKALARKLTEADKNYKGPRGKLALAPLDPLVTVANLQDPHRLAGAFLAAHYWHRGQPTLRYWQEGFWAWDGTRYQTKPDGDVAGELNAFIEDDLNANTDRINERRLAKLLELSEAERRLGGNKKLQKEIPKPAVTNTLVGNVLSALKSEKHGLVKANIGQPSWLGEGAEEKSYFAFQNGLVEAAKLIAGEKVEVQPHDPRWFSRTCFAYPFDPAAHCPKWTQALSKSFSDDPEKGDLLSEWIGYCLTTDTSLHAWLIMVGEGHNGKSTVCSAMAAVLGEANISAVPLEGFNAQFGLADTLGKLANITAEIGDLDKTAEGTVKAFVSGDAIQINRKYKPALTARPTARLTFATNNLPHFRDRTDGFWRRLIVLPFRTKIAQAEKISGMDNPSHWKEEASGMFNWALAGLQRLRKRGRFQIPESCLQEAQDHQTDCNPAALFFDAHCELCATGEIPTKILFAKYVEFCGENNNKPLNHQGFGREVRRRTGLEKKKSTKGDRGYFYPGIQLQSTALADGQPADDPQTSWGTNLRRSRGEMTIPMETIGLRADAVPL